MDKHGKAYKQLRNKNARIAYLNTMKVLGEDPAPNYNTMNADMLKRLAQDAYERAPKRKKRKALKVLHCDKKTMRRMLSNRIRYSKPKPEKKVVVDLEDIKRCNLN